MMQGYAASKVGIWPHNLAFFGALREIPTEKTDAVDVRFNSTVSGLYVRLRMSGNDHQPSQIEQIVDLNISDLPCGTPLEPVCHEANPRS